MECLECSWFQIYVGITVGAIVTFLISLLVLWLIRNPLKPKMEKSFEDNAKVIRGKMITHLNEVNYWMYRLFKELEKIENFNGSKNSSYTITSGQFTEFQYNKEKINELWKKIQILHDSPNTITFNEYLIIQKFVTAIHSTVHFTSNKENHIFFDSKSLEFVWYYAKLIMLTIDDERLNKFKDDWQSDFNLVGGIDKIEKPKMEPGDILTIHHDLNDELFYYDAKYSGIMTRFREVMKEFGDMKKEIEKLQK